MATTRLSIITPSAVKFEGDVALVVAPGAAGDLGALPNHAPLLTTLRTGVVTAVLTEPAQTAQAGSRLVFAVDAGFMQVLADKVIILTDVALGRDEVNDEEARAALRHAEDALAQKRGADDAAARHDIAWARARLDIIQRPA